MGNRTLTPGSFCIPHIPAGAPFPSQGMVGKSKWLAKGRSIKRHSVSHFCGTVCQTNPFEQAFVCSYDYTEHGGGGQQVAINSGRAESISNGVNYTNWGLA